MSDNPSSAANQQERPRVETISPDIGWYLAGFTDGEGSFNVSTVNRNKDFTTGWKIVPTFNISQRDHTILHLFQETLRCGRIHDRGDGVGYYDVRRIDDLIGIVIPFFQRFPLRSVSKRKQFDAFSTMTRLIFEKEHHTFDGLKRILDLRDTIKVARKRKYSTEQILTSFRSRNPQRLYAELRSPSGMI
ncbi:MAG: homing endonuclease LAGLIDADG/HNH [Candidatus Peregrinibacteria bacterium Greene0416_19]|nr:MAG: homing endonuclease LAGLIDADG/HNH [Candidatus Peregrinibacteria bacterium Greene0416_19]